MRISVSSKDEVFIVRCYVRGVVFVERWRELCIKSLLAGKIVDNFAFVCAVSYLQLFFVFHISLVLSLCLASALFSLATHAFCKENFLRHTLFESFERKEQVLPLF